MVVIGLQGSMVEFADHLEALSLVFTEMSVHFM
jgi:hypothetical protein